MISDLKEHKLLARKVRRRLTRSGWITITEAVIEEKADQCRHGGDWDSGWPPGWGVRPLGDDTTVYWDNGWPQAFAPGRIPHVWAQMELGTRATMALLRSARLPHPGLPMVRERVDAPGSERRWPRDHPGC